MKRSLIICFLAGVMMLVGTVSSYAEMCGSMGRPADYRHEDGMRPMRGIKHPGMGMTGEEHSMWRGLMALALDEKQKEAIKEIKNKAMKEMIKKKADGHIARIELKELLDEDSVNMKAVEAKLKQIETAKTEMRLSFIRTMEEVKSKLTAEQKKKFKEMPRMGSTMGSTMMGRAVHDGKRIPHHPCETVELR